MTDSPFNNKIQLTRQQFFFKFLLFYQRHINRKGFEEIKMLAAYLEEFLLPPLNKMRQETATIDIAQTFDKLIFINLDLTTQEIPQTALTAKALSNIGVKRLVLDSRLEKNQIVESLSTFLYAGSELTRQTIQSAPPSYVLDKQQLAQALVSRKGFNRFCAQLFFSAQEQLLTIQYSYCELLYTYSLRQLLSQFTITHNHRTLFAFAPWAGLLTATLLFTHIWFWGQGSVKELLAGLFASTIFGGVTSYLILTLASILYDQEHRDLMQQESIREITALSHFPKNNPNPIMKVNRQGEFLYHNKAAEKLLAKIKEQPDQLHKILPGNYLDLIQQCLDSNNPLTDIETSSKKLTLRYNITRFPDEQAVLLAGSDISLLKRLELELRDFNQTLEQKVVERTKELQATQDVTIFSLSSLAETRDPETGAHIQRTSLYVKILAEFLQNHPRFKEHLKNDNVIDLLYRSAPLHDVGKVGIRDSILLKPEPLTEKEFAEMKRHTIIGGDALLRAEKQLGSNSFLQYAREIAYNHHEWWDGTGYPYGLKGDNIPFSGRIMALADVYDALVNKRVYKEAFTHDKARAIILEGKDTHFDPAVVEAFLKLENQFIAIADQYKD